MRHSPFAAALALSAVLFGGLLLGLGNMLDLALRAQAEAATADAHAHHGHHGHHGAEPAEAATPLILTLPAHCLFCLEGIAPQPIPLREGLPPVRLRPLPPRAVVAVGTPARPPSTPYQERAPPVLV